MAVKKHWVNDKAERGKVFWTVLRKAAAQAGDNLYEDGLREKLIDPTKARGEVLRIAKEACGFDFDDTIPPDFAGTSGPGLADPAKKPGPRNENDLILFFKLSGPNDKGHHDNMHIMNLPMVGEQLPEKPTTADIEKYLMCCYPPWPPG